MKHSQKVSKSYLQAVKSDLDTSWECSMCDNSELSWQVFFIMGVNGCLLFSNIGDRRLFWNKY